MRKYLLFSFLLLLGACTEEIDMRSRSDYHDYLAVQATLTDRADQPQQVILSRTISYFHSEAQPMVKRASVTVNDVVFTETEDGVYVAPEGYCCRENEPYHLHIRLPGGEEYEADAQMPEPGFLMEKIDYAWGGEKTMGADSLWTVGVWGVEKEIESCYLVTHAVNGLYEPFGQAMVSKDLFFNNNKVVAFPIVALLQVEALRKQYGECYKYLEEGDEITLEIWTLDPGYKHFLESMKTGGFSIPLFSPQPANLGTNIRGEHVLGYFAVCPVARASVTVDNPFRPYFNISQIPR